MSVHSDVIYHHFPISSQYLKTWGVDSPLTYTGSRELQVLFIRYVLRKQHYYHHYYHYHYHYIIVTLTGSRKMSD